MNVVLWILQVLLALETFAGGAYKVFMLNEISQVPAMAALSPGGWSALGWLEMVCAVLLVVPAATKWKPVLTPIGAAVLALESFGLAGLYGRYSLQLAPTNPMLYVLVGGLLAAIVAYGRYSLMPKAGRSPMSGTETPNASPSH